MENLDRVIAAYIAMDQRHKNENLAHMENDAAKYPTDQEGRPGKLRLVVNNPHK